MACNFLKISKCDICGKEKRNFFLDKFKFLTADGDEIYGRYCWRCAFRYDRYNFLLHGKGMVLGVHDEQKVIGK